MTPTVRVLSVLCLALAFLPAASSERGPLASVRGPHTTATGRVPATVPAARPFPLPRRRGRRPTSTALSTPNLLWWPDG